MDGEGQSQVSGDACLTCALWTATALGWALDDPPAEQCGYRQCERAVILDRSFQVGADQKGPTILG